MFFRGGFVVFLYADPEVLYKRVLGDTRRPLLRNETDMGRIWRERESLYRGLAHTTIDTSTIEVEEVIQILNGPNREAH